MQTKLTYIFIEDTNSQDTASIVFSSFRSSMIRKVASI